MNNNIRKVKEKKKSIKKNIHVRNARKNPHMEERPRISQEEIVETAKELYTHYKKTKTLPNWNKESEMGKSEKSLILCGNIVASEDDILESIGFYLKSCNNFLQLFKDGNLKSTLPPDLEYKKSKNKITCNFGNASGFSNDMFYNETRLKDWINLYDTEEGKEAGYVYINMDNDSNNPYSAKINGKQYMESLDKVLSKEKYPVSAMEIEIWFEGKEVMFLYGEAYILTLGIDEYMLVAFSLNSSFDEDTITHIYFPSILAETDTTPNEEDVNLEDCGSLNLISTKIPNMEVLQRLDGKNILLDTGELHMINAEEDLWLIGDTVNLRSEITCLNSHTICKVCRGKIKDEVE